VLQKLYDNDPETLPRKKGFN